MGLKISGNICVFKNEKGYYSTGISNKLMDGSYENAYLPIQFKKGTELNNKDRIIINSGFLSFYKNQEGKTVYKIVVTDFNKEGDAKEPEVVYDDSNSLPF